MALDLPSVFLMGVDEVGRGPWAGPVCAGAVILLPSHGIAGLDDSKKLSARRRQALAPEIRAACRSWGLGWASAEEIDQHNILVASFRAMQRAVVDCLSRLAPDAKSHDEMHWSGLHIQVDGHLLPTRSLGAEQWPWNTEAVVGGDACVAEISAASIIAKVARDDAMEKFDQAYPGYGFAQHAGYGTKLHQAALDRLGPSPIHRRSFAPVARFIGGAA